MLDESFDEHDEHDGDPTPPIGGHGPGPPRLYRKPKWLMRVASLFGSQPIPELPSSDAMFFEADCLTVAYQIGRRLESTLKDRAMARARKQGRRLITADDVWEVMEELMPDAAWLTEE